MSQLWMNAWGNRRWDACQGLMSTFLASPLGLIFYRVLLVTGSWASWVGVAGVIRRARVRWVMGSSVSVSVLFLISGGSMMSTLGAE